MGSGDNFSDGLFKTRPVLTDVTNRPGKRPFSLISSDSPHKSGEGDSQFAKQVCLGVENLVKEKCHQLQFGVDSQDKGKVLLKPKGKKPCVMLPFSSAADSSPQIISFTENSSGFREKVQGTLTSGASQTRPLTEGLINQASESDERNLSVEKLASSKCGAVESSTISTSKDSKFLGLERCVGLKGDGSANSVVGGLDLLKDCSCSFCTKAAYVLSDLHYQDVKGRLNALKRSHKEASIMVQKFSGAKDTVIHEKQNCTEASKLEFYLMNQWKSLFLHMENTFAHESSQLESGFETLKDLRENCKNDLELIDNYHYYSH